MTEDAIQNRAQDVPQTKPGHIEGKQQRGARPPGPATDSLNRSSRAKPGSRRFRPRLFGILTDAKIAIRIGIIALVPMLALMAYAGSTVLESWTLSEQIGKLQKLERLAPVVSALVHEMQKERGMSAGYIGSNGEKFADELPKQREATSKRFEAFAVAVDGFPLDQFGEDFGAAISTAQEALAGLADKRKAVSGLTFTVPQMAKYYTGTIVRLLHAVEQMAVLSPDSHATNAITAYTAFLQAKERAGIERAMGATGFGAGEFKPAVYRKFLQLIAMQDTFLSIFRGQGSHEQWEFYQSTVSGEAVDEVNRIRGIAIESVVTGSTEGIEATDWFKTITKKINLLKTVEDRLAEDLGLLIGEIRAEAETAFYLNLVLAGLLLVVVTGLSVFVSRGISRPVASMTNMMTALADKDLSVEIIGTERRDEIGDMARAVEVFKHNAIEAEKLEAEKREEEARSEQRRKEREAEQEKRAQRAEEIQEACNAFDQSVSGVIETVSSASTELQTTAQTLSATAEQTTERATTVAAASEEASTNVQTVASAAEEMSSSVDEIGRQVSQSTEIAGKAVSEAQRTNETVQGLAEAAQKIGDVVNLISDIAEQTNLLALNATIEAARAGDAGKGFAVVASEVKSLANQTAKATEEIGAQIGSMQSVTGEAVEAIEGIGTTIGQISEIATAISAAVEEQGAATQEIARNVQEAARGTTEVSSNITGVNQAATETGAASKQVLDATGQLSREAEGLKNEVDRFLSEIRAA